MNLNQLYKHFAQHQESTWIMQPYNAKRLYDFIMKNPIKRVLGLGTGIGLSDAVVALAWLHKGEKEGHLDSIEQYDKCIKLANELIPAELKAFITIIKSDPMVWETDKIPYQPMSIYKDPELMYEVNIGGVLATQPKLAYDLIINDGPSPFMDGENYLELPNGTIQKFTIEDKIKPGTKIIYDGRVTSLNMLERYLGNNYFLTFVPPRGEDFVVLEKKDAPLIIRDDKLVAMKQQTIYFKNHEENIISSDKQSASGETTNSIEGATK